MTLPYITPRKVFAHLDRLVGWQSGDKPAPVTVEFDLSNRCYLGCQSCHFAHTHTRGPWVKRDRFLPMAWEGTGDFADIVMVKRALGEMAAGGVRGVVWSGGGEPTTHPWWKDALSTGSTVGLRQGMYTAGGLITKASAVHMAQHLAWVVVSLDTVDAETYASEKGVQSGWFDRACQGIRDLVAAGQPVVGVSFLLHQQNWSEADDMLALARSLGATYTTFRPTIETHPDHPAICVGDRRWIEDALPLLDRLSHEPDVQVSTSRFEAYADWTDRGYDVCHGIKLHATVTPDGRVWVCVQRRGMVGSCVGDLRTESFAEIWQRHPGQWTDFAECRVMCRLHQVNEQLDPVFAEMPHEAFV